jgi:hypothetical protein
MRMSSRWLGYCLNSIWSIWYRSRRITGEIQGSKNWADIAPHSCSVGHNITMHMYKYSSHYFKISQVINPPVTRIKKIILPICAYMNIFIYKVYFQGHWNGVNRKMVGRKEASWAVRTQTGILSEVKLWLQRVASCSIGTFRNSCSLAVGNKFIFEFHVDPFKHSFKYVYHLLSKLMNLHFLFHMILNVNRIYFLKRR